MSELFPINSELIPINSELIAIDSELISTNVQNFYPLKSISNWISDSENFQNEIWIPKIFRMKLRF